MATALVSVALALVPMATALPLVARDKLPMATALTPLAVLEPPKATAFCALALLLLPSATAALPAALALLPIATAPPPAALALRPHTTALAAPVWLPSTQYTAATALVAGKSVKPPMADSPKIKALKLPVGTSASRLLRAGVVVEPDDLPLPLAVSCTAIHVPVVSFHTVL